jgi:hypothetical protein
MPGQPAVSPDERYRDWVERIERIQAETTYLFWSRKLFRAIQGMFQTNQRLGAVGGDAWQWLLGIYGRDAVMAIRREMDGQAGVVNLFHLLHEMRQHAVVLTRARYYDLFVGSLAPIRHMAKDFERLGGPPGPGTPDDHIAPQVIAADLETLRQKTDAPFSYAQRLVAHRTPAGEVPLTVEKIDNALKAVFDCMRKYYLLLTAKNLVGATPVPQYDWLAPFRIPWATSAFDAPSDE